MMEGGSFYKPNNRLFIPSHVRETIGFIAELEKIRPYLCKEIIAEMVNECYEFNSIVMDYRDLCFYLSFFKYYDNPSYNPSDPKSEPLIMKDNPKEDLFRIFNMMSICYVDGERNIYWNVNDKHCKIPGNFLINDMVYIAFVPVLTKLFESFHFISSHVFDVTLLKKLNTHSFIFVCFVSNLDKSTYKTIFDLLEYYVTSNGKKNLSIPYFLRKMNIIYKPFIRVTSYPLCSVRTITTIEDYYADFSSSIYTIHADLLPFPQHKFLTDSSSSLFKETPDEKKKKRDRDDVDLNITSDQVRSDNTILFGSKIQVVTNDEEEVTVAVAPSTSTIAKSVVTPTKKSTTAVKKSKTSFMDKKDVDDEMFGE